MVALATMHNCIFRDFIINGSTHLSWNADTALYSTGIFRFWAIS